MIRWLGLAVLVVAISAAAAWITQSVTAVDTATGDIPFPSATIAKQEIPGPAPTLILEEATTHQFGLMGQEEIGTKEYTIGNEGPGDLILTGTQPSCSCTVGNLKPGESVTVKPGEQFLLKIQWETRQFTGPYEKYASIETNDPRRPVITFTMKGEIQPDFIIMPEGGSIEARQVANDRPHEFSAILSCPTRPETAIVSMTSSKPELLQLSQRPLDEKELANLGLKKGAVRVGIQIQPTSQLGPFLEELVLQTDHPKRSELRLSIGGTLVGPISVVPSSIRMRDVYTNRGQQTSVILWVRGQETTTFEVAKKPDALELTIVPVEDKAKGENAVGRAYRMTVSVKPGTPPGVLDDPIILKTDHPNASELMIPVEIRILGES